MYIAMWATSAVTTTLVVLLGVAALALTQGDDARRQESSLASLSWRGRFSDGVGRRLKLPQGVLSHVRKRQVSLADDKPDKAYQSCIMPGEKPGKCRHLQYCVLEDFRASFPRFLDYLCIIERSFVGVCCPDRPDQEQGSFLPASDLTDLGLPASARQLTSPTRDANAGASITSKPRGCGVGSKSDVPTTAGRSDTAGRPTSAKEFPWMAGLLRDKDLHFCGGVLISDRHVLTAAHCTTSFQASEILVRLGEYNFKVPDETRFQDFEVSEIRQHVDYEAATYENDISILKLDRPAQFNTYIWPICLPPPGPSYENQTATVIGWGTLSYGGPVSPVLMEVSVPVWINQECDPRFTQPILDTMLCAGAFEGGKDACQGDSGGPLLIQLANQRWATIGVVSWGIRCGEAGRPGIYTRVNRYLSWIHQNVLL